MSENENEKRETVDYVLAEMLERADAMQTHGTTHGIRLAIREFARRIKAAWKWERAKVEADALEVGGIVEAARTAEKSSAVGNTAAIREALKQALYFLRRHHMGAVYAPDGETLIFCEDVAKIVDDALSAPARNCDMEYTDRVEMYSAFKDWCKAKGHTMEPMLAYDAFDWLLAPAKKEKGEGE